MKLRYQTHQNPAEARVWPQAGMRPADHTWRTGVGRRWMTHIHPGDLLASFGAEDFGLIL